MNATHARLELLSAAVHAIAAAMPRERGRLAARELRATAGELATTDLDAAADAALAGELAKLLAALEGAAPAAPAQRDTVLR